MRLYEITEELQDIERQLEEYAIEHEGDITDFPFSEKLEQFEGMREHKLLNIGAWIKNLKAEEAAFTAEIKNLSARKSATVSRSARLISFVESQLDEGEKLSDSRVAYSWRKSSPVIIDNLAKVPKKFCIEHPKEASKSLIKSHLALKKKVTWAHIEEKQNLQIK